MSVAPHPTHPGWYQVIYYPDGSKGKKAYITVKTGEEDAHFYDQELKRNPPGGTRPAALFPNISDTIIDYVKYYSLDHLDTSNVQRSLRRWMYYVGKLKFSAVNASHIENYKHDRLSKGIKPVTINKELSALAGLIKWGAKKGYCAAPNYFERFSNKKTKSPLPDVPTREEVVALIDCAIWPKCGLLACLYWAGLRANEARCLRAEDVHLDRRVMIVTGKGNKQRPVAIVDTLVPWLNKRIMEVGTGLLWTTRNGQKIDDIGKIIELAAKRAGITRRFYPHILRHAYGTHSTMAGVPIRHTQYNMGHTSSHTTEIYTTLGHNAIIDEIVGKFGKV